jgi:hypothetical protein
MEDSNPQTSPETGRQVISAVDCECYPAPHSPHRPLMSSLAWHRARPAPATSQLHARHTRGHSLAYLRVGLPSRALCRQSAERSLQLCLGVGGKLREVLRARHVMARSGGRLLRDERRHLDACNLRSTASREINEEVSPHGMDLC